MVAGREFTAADNAQAPKVVIVNESFARQFWPNENPIGKRVVVGRWSDPAEVVGESVDVKNKGLEQETQPQLYLSFPQLPWGDMNLLLRTAVEPRSITSAVRAQVAALDADQPITNIQTVDDLMDASRSQPRFTMLLLALFSGTALVLAIIGIYGVLAYSVAQRREEFGIRLALGAEHSDILRLVLRQGLILAAAGIVTGLVASLLLTRLMSRLLYKTGAHDLTTFILTPLLILVITLFASYFPARRATEVNPIEALR
jgi:predicted permease